MADKIILTTNRLLIREFNTDDAPFVFKLVNSPDYIKYIADRNIKSEEDAKRFIENDFLQSYAQHGFGSFHASLNTNGHAIGSGGLKKRDFLTYPDLGYVLLPEYYGSGYAFEMAQALLYYGIKQLGFRKIHAMILPENKRSVHLISKLDFYFDGEFILPTSGELINLYSYTSTF